jgi:hypothetical protein
MANTASNVTAGKPAIAGAIHFAPKGTTLPADTTTALDAAFECLGYVSDAGLTNSTSLETTDIKAWGGDTVLNIQTSKDDKFSFTLLEILNESVLAFVNGSTNVTGDLSTGLTVTVNNKDVEEVAIVIDMLLRDNTAKRIVIPDCKISEMGDVVYSDSEAVGYETTVTCIPDSNGNTHYEYLLKSAG